MAPATALLLRNSPVTNQMISLSCRETCTTCSAASLCNRTLHKPLCTFLMQQCPALLLMDPQGLEPKTDRL